MAIPYVVHSNVARRMLTDVGLVSILMMCSRCQGLRHRTVVVYDCSAPSPMQFVLVRLTPLYQLDPAGTPSVTPGAGSIELRGCVLVIRVDRPSRGPLPAAREGASPRHAAGTRGWRS